MALDDIPPWISVRPTDFGQAAGEGARLDLARVQADASLKLDAAKLATQQQSMALEAQKLQADQQQTAMQLQMRKEEMDRNFNLQAAQLATTTELKKQEMAQDAIKVAKIGQQQSMYQKAMSDIMSQNPDMKPEDAAYQASLVTGYDLGPMGAQMFRANTEGVPVYGKDGTTQVGIRIGGTVKMFPTQHEGSGGVDYSSKDVADLALKLIQNDPTMKLTPDSARAQAIQLLGGQTQSGSAAAPSGGAFDRYRIVSSTGTAAAPVKAAPAAEEPAPVEEDIPKTGIPEIDDAVRVEMEAKKNSAESSAASKKAATIANRKGIVDRLNNELKATISGNAPFQSAVDKAKAVLRLRNEIAEATQLLKQAEAGI
jgi:hypothetical protein